MRAGMYGAGINIERVLHPPVASPRRFRGLLDTVFTVALGSVCAFALTLGPAPMNTVAVTSAAAESFAPLEPAPASAPLVADEVDDDQPASEEASKSGPAPSNSAEPVRPDTEVIDNSTGRAPVAPTTAPAEPAPLKPAAPVVSPAKPVVTGVAKSAAVAIVEAYRTASGLPTFVAADACLNPAVHSTVQVTPPAVLPLGLAKMSLAPHPAFATAEDNGNGNGATVVTIYACQ